MPDSAVPAAVASLPASQPEKPTRRDLGGWVSLIAFLGLHVGALLAFVVPLTWTAAGMCLGFYAVRVFGLTGGYHRLFAHRAYKATRWFQFVVAWFGAMAIQRGPLWWAGSHRIHHKHSDQEGDPHSPVTKSAWWAHIGWVIAPGYREMDPVLMKDFYKYPEIRLLDRFDWVPGVLLGVFCAAAGGLSGFVWGFLVSTVLVYHVTFMVNSVCHLVGKRRFDTPDASRNNWVVGLLTFGEGWHNNHHHYPSAARQGFKWWEVDISYCVLKVLSWFGVVWDLRQPTPRALAARAIPQG